MSLFHRRRAVEEQRGVTSLPWSHDGASPFSDSMEGQLALVPVYAAVRLIADSVSALPLQAYRKTGDGRIPMALPRMFANPFRATRMTWVEQAMTSLLLRGNAYGLKAGLDSETMAPGDVTWLHPDLVSYSDVGGWNYAGHPVAEQDMVHIPGLVMPGNRLGVSPITACSAAVMAGLSTQAFMKDWYRNKAIPSMTMQNTERTITPEVAAAVKERAQSTIRSGEPFVTGKDWKLDIMTLTADDAGFVAASKLTATQVATIFGIPPAMIGGETGGSLTYSTVELNQLQFLTNTLLPWITRLEATFSALLQGDQYVKFNVDALIRADTKTRHEVYKLDRDMGLHNIDELRRFEDEEPLPDGKGADYAPLGSAQGDSPARLVQQMYLGVGKVITAKEAREILKAAGAYIDDAVTIDELHKSLPPMAGFDDPPAQGEPT